MTWLITGSENGIGQALVKACLLKNDFVIGIDKVPKNPDNDFPYPHILANISNPTDIREAVRLVRKIKTVDILINNAGIMPDKGKEKVDPTDLENILNTNVRGTILLTEELLPFMNPQGQIVFVSSGRSSLEKDFTDAHMYGLSKAFLNTYATKLSLRTTIITSAIDPGWVRTAMGGPDAPYSPEEAADWIYRHVEHPKPTGKFWKLSPS
jgi:NAD(P)-dependent dehydrogenase (short-subunit alcohol dehydrogenase family)